MNASEVLLDRLTEYYASEYELTGPYRIDQTFYDFYAYYRGNHFYDHAFVRNSLSLTKTDLLRFSNQVTSFIEPHLVLGGRNLPEPAHMYSYVTGVFISEQRISQSVINQLQRFHYYKGYGFFRYGYCQARIAAFDLERGTMYASAGAKELLSEYARVLK